MLRFIVVLIGVYTLSLHSINAQSIILTKNGIFNDENGDNIPQAGETISYSFSIQNTGNVNLTNVTVFDPIVTIMGNNISLLTPGQFNTTTFSGTYLITQADINTGSVENTATTQAKDPNNNIVSSMADDIVVLNKNPEISLIKTGTFNDENGDGLPQAGETISYSFTVENTGNVNLSNIIINDPLISIIGGPLFLLKPQQIDNSTFSGLYQLTTFDSNMPTLINTATVVGFESNNQISSVATEETALYKICTICDLANGIYGGNGTVPSNTIANLSDMITFNGDIAVAGEILGASDIKLKEKMDDIMNASQIINKLNPKSYTFKTDKNIKLPTGIHYGLIAQDVEKILPEIIGNIPAEDGLSYKGINYQSIIPILISGMKEQQSEIDKLKKELTTLKILFSKKNKD